MAKKINRRIKGEGTLIKRGNIWYARWVANGKTFSKSTGTANKRDAEEKLKEFTAPFKLGGEVEALEAIATKISGRQAELERLEEEKPALKVVEVWEAFVGSPERGDMSDRTLGDYKGQWKRFERWMEERSAGAELRRVTAKDAAAYATDLNQAGLTGNSFNKHINLLRMVFRVLAESARMEGSPWDKIKPRKHRTEGRRVFTPEELQVILSNASGELQILLTVGAYTGLRLGDAVLLDWSAVNLERGIITVQPRKTASRTGKVVGIPVHPTLGAVLGQTSVKDRKGVVMPELAEMYASNPYGINYRLQKHFRECGIETTVKRSGSGQRGVAVAGFHSLRHTLVSELVSRGASLESVRGIVGHGGEAMTRAYVHHSAEALRGAVEALPSSLEVKPVVEAVACGEGVEAVLGALDGLTVQELRLVAARVQELLA